jgi:hypothetical protein
VKEEIKKLLVKIFPYIEFIFVPFVLLLAILFKGIRASGIKNFPICKKILLMIGVFPIRDHYYEPLFNSKYLRKPLSNDRNLPSINFNTREQLKILKKLNFGKELADIQIQKKNDLTYYYNNVSFLSGDARSEEVV